MRDRARVMNLGAVAFALLSVGCPHKKGPDTTPPSWNSGATLVAFNVTATNATLAWSSASDDVAVTSYLVFQDDVKIATLGNVLTTVVGNLRPAVPFHFRVEAIDAAGNISTAGPTLTVTPPDESAPTWPVGSTLSATSVTATSATLTWSAAADDVAVTGYFIFQNDVKIATLGNVLTTVVGNLRPAVPFHFRVEAIDAAGILSSSGPTLTVTPPDQAAPTWPSGSTLVATNVTATSATLAWSSASDDVAVTSYLVFQDDVKIATLGNVLTTVVGNLKPAVAFRFRVEAIDAAGNISSGGPTLTVTLPDQAAPTWPNGSTLTVSNLGLTSATLSWSAAIDDVAVTGYLVFQNGAQVATLGNVLTTQLVNLTPGAAVKFRIEATDAAGNISTGGPIATVTPLPPDPVTVAPPLSTTVATNMAAASAFLYSGPNPVQLNVAPGAIEKRRVAVLRGNVRDGTGPLSGVTITILGHPEYGYTLTRADGQFDLAVSGGGKLTVDYTLAGYCPAQRTDDVPWQDFVVLPDLVMVAMDPAVTPIDVTARSTVFQVARGSLVTDKDGTRQATILFPPGTQALLRMPDGSTQLVSPLHVRATEFTVGADGKKAMPADLPPNSSYTYAVELSADEAVAAGATGVEFNQPVFVYLENFLGVPAGTTVPNGFYDRQRAVWAAEQNGLAISIVSMTNNAADLDVDGSGNVASAATLAGLGMGDGKEQEQLAKLYKNGQNLWRVPVAHFSATDFNFFGPTAQQKFIDFPDKFKRDDPNKDPPTDPNFELDNQTVRQSLPIVGTPFSLNYRSDRVPGRLPTIDITVLDDKPHPGLSSIDLSTLIAGRLETVHLLPSPNAHYLFTWSRKDSWDRTVQGSLPLKVRLGYNLGANYAPTSKFGDNGCGGHVPCDPLPCTARFCPSGQPVVATREPETITQDEDLRIGQLDARAHTLGGWSLSVHHTYDPVGKILYLGTGDVIAAETLSQVIKSTAGTGVGNCTTPGCGDGGPATSAQLGQPRSINVAPDGAMVFVDRPGNGKMLVRKVQADGTISSIAGGGQSRDDGVLATNANLDEINKVILGPDGATYFSTCTGLACPTHRVRKIGKDGIVTTIAGSKDKSGFGGDGGPASSALLSSPKSISFGPDGSLYIADSGNSRIRRVGTDGIISTIVGGHGDCGQFCGSGANSTCDLGKPASLARIAGASAVGVAPDGSVYFQPGCSPMLRIRPDGILDKVDTGKTNLGQGVSNITVARDGSLFFTVGSFGAAVYHRGLDGSVNRVGGNDQGGFSGEDGPATQAQLSAPDSVAIAPDGTLVVADTQNNRLRQIRPPLPGYNGGELLIASGDGAAVFKFDESGRHLATLDAMTAAVIYSFVYDVAGNLLTVTDGDGNVTTIARDGAGNPTAIVGPYGQSTTLALDQDGFLASVTNPAAETTKLSSTQGLLTSITDPKGNVRKYGYDSQGRPISGTDAAGASKTWVRTDIPSEFNSFSLHQTSAENVASDYRVETSLSGDSFRTTTYADQTREVISFLANGQESTSFADGVLKTVVPTPDPRFGMQVPLPLSSTVITPKGLKTTCQIARTVTLSDPKNPLSLASEVDAITIDGRTAKVTFDAASLTRSTISPEGRRSVVTLDQFGRTLQTQLGNLFATTTKRDPQGRTSSVSVGSGTGARTASIAYGKDGFPASLTDPAGQTVTVTFDGAGRTTQTKRPDGQVTKMAYDANGNLLALTPPGRPASTFAYDVNNRMTSFTPPAVTGTGPTTFAYDKDGRPTLVTRPDAVTVSIAYDGTGRFSSTRFPGETIGFTYNASTGRLATLSSAAGLISYQFDGSLPLSESWSGGSVTGSVQWSYDNSQRIQTESVNGSSVTFVHDKDDLLVATGAMTIVPDPQTGLLAGTAISNTVTQVTRNGFGEKSKVTATVSGKPVYTVSYDTRDALGRITSKTETISGTSTSYAYAYDAVGRLTQATKGAAQATSTYDANGNRCPRLNPCTTASGTTVGADYDDQDRLIQYGSNTYTYSANGELSTKSVGGQLTTYTYDARSNLKSVALPDGTKIDYVVDAIGRRIGKKRSGTLQRGFLYSGPLRIVAELDANGAIVSRFVYGTSAAPDHIVRDGKTFRMLSDQVGSVRLVIDASDGTVAQQIDYDELGNILSDTNPGFQPFGFASGIYDADTKLVHFGARDYDAETGRWTAKDPILFGGGSTNLYEYARGDPVNHLDRFGLKVDYEKLVQKETDEFELAVGSGAATALGINAMIADAALPPFVVTTEVTTTTFAAVPAVETIGRLTWGVAGETTIVGTTTTSVSTSAAGVVDLIAAAPVGIAGAVLAGVAGGTLIDQLLLNHLDVNGHYSPNADPQHNPVTEALRVAIGGGSHNPVDARGK